MKTSYLNQWVNYGGEWATVGAIYAESGDVFAGRWLSGYETAGGEFRARKPTVRELSAEYRQWLRNTDMTSVYRPEAA